MIDIMVYILILLVFIIFAIDIVPIFLDWISRIHIGRYNNKKIWSDMVCGTSIKWLNKTPKIKVTDNTRLVFIDMINKNYTKDAIQYWQKAALLLGVSEYKKYNDKNDLDIFLNSNFDKNGDWIKKPINIDAAILTYSLMNLNNDKLIEYKPSLDYMWNMIKEHIGKDGTVKYRKHMDNYRYVDTIGFICPFLIKYGMEFNNNEAIELALNQIKKYREHGMLINRQIPYHAYDVNSKIPLGLCGWGRGLGWYAIGLIDSWNELPEEDVRKDELTKYVIEFAKEIIKIQNANGGWNWTATRNETRTDSSTTATLAWFLINAAKINEIKDICKEATNKSIEYLMSVTRRNGAVDFSQGDTKDIGVYSMLFSILPFTQGFALRTISKMLNEDVKNEV